MKMSDNLEETDNELIREQRRARRKLKKEEKRNKKEKEKELKTLALKFGSKDTHVTLVTREFARSFSASTTENLSNSDIKQEDFPYLGQKHDNLYRRTYSVLNPENVSCSSVSMDNNCLMQEEQLVALELNDSTDLKPDKNKEKKSKAPIVLEIKDIIKSDANNSLKISKDKSLANVKPETYNGNILDSSQPIRKKGKCRELTKPKKPNTFKAAVLKEKINNQNVQIPLETYCDNIINKELDDIITLLIKEIVNFQEKLYKRDPVKGASKRRYVVGFHEVKKYLKVGKISLIVFAPNIQITGENSIFVKTLNDFKMLANVHECPYIFALSRRILGRLCLKTVSVSCFGILNYSGAEKIFKSVLPVMEKMKEEFRKTQILEENKTIADELSSKLLNALKF